MQISVLTFFVVLHRIKHLCEPKFNAALQQQQADHLHEILLTLYVTPSQSLKTGTFISFHIRLQWLMMYVGVLGHLGKPTFTQLIRLLPFLAPTEGHLWHVNPGSLGSQPCQGTSARPCQLSITVYDLSDNERNVYTRVWERTVTVLLPFKSETFRSGHTYFHEWPLQSKLNI